MHLLAHIFLSGNTPNIMIGNFIGEVKPVKDISNYNKEFRTGVYLHSLIDKFAHEHPIFQKSKKRLNPKYAKFSDSIIDIFYDHFLACNWTSYSLIPLEKFTSNTYRTLEENKSTLPYKARNFLPHMVKEDWLAKYATLEGTHKTILDLDKVKFPKQYVAYATQDLIDNYSSFKEDFNEFFPHLMNYIKVIRQLEVSKDIQREMLDMAS